MKLSVNEAVQLIDLWARNCAAIQEVLILNLPPGPKSYRTFTGPFEERTPELNIVARGQRISKLVLHTLGGPVWLESSTVRKIWHRPKEQLRRSKLNCHSSVILNKFSRDEGVRQLIQGTRLSSWPAQNFHWITNKLKKNRKEQKSWVL